MNAREYLEKQNATQAVTFIVARAVKDEESPAYKEFYNTSKKYPWDRLTPNPKLKGSPGYHVEYLQTPIRTVSEWLQNDGPGSRFGENYMVVGIDRQPIDRGPGFVRSKYQSGKILCAVITTKADMLTMYTEEDLDEMQAILDIW